MIAGNVVAVAGVSNGIGQATAAGGFRVGTSAGWILWTKT